MDGTKGALLLTGALLGFAIVLGYRQNSGNSGGNGILDAQQGLTLRQVNSPEYQPASGGPVVRPYIDESPGNPNEQGGQRVFPGHFGVSRQQASGLL